LGGAGAGAGSAPGGAAEPDEAFLANAAEATLTGGVSLQ
jgi:hypothetical protein